LDGGGDDAGAPLADARTMATTERDRRSRPDEEVVLQLPAPDAGVPLGALPALGSRRTELHLIACSRCLRVLRDEQWVRAETVIRDLRTFEQDQPPCFEPVLCPLCTFSIHLRRAEVG
jgi:hypothetical protein